MGEPFDPKSPNETVGPSLWPGMPPSFSFWPSRQGPQMGSCGCPIIRLLTPVVSPFRKEIGSPSAPPSCDKLRRRATGPIMTVPPSSMGPFEFSGSSSPRPAGAGLLITGRNDTCIEKPFQSCPGVPSPIKGDPVSLFIKARVFRPISSFILVSYPIVSPLLLKPKGAQNQVRRF